MGLDPGVFGRFDLAALVQPHLKFLFVCPSKIHTHYRLPSEPGKRGAGGGSGPISSSSGIYIFVCLFCYIHM